MAIAQHSKDIAKGTFWGLSGNMLLKLVSFFYLVILTRMATQADIGEFYLGLSVLGIVILVADLGLPGAVIRYLPFYQEKGGMPKVMQLIRVSYAAVSIFSAIVSVIMFLLADPIAGFMNNSGLSQTIRLLSPYILLNSIFSLNSSIFQGVKDIRTQSMLSNIQNIMKLILTILLVFTIGATAFSIAVGFVLSFVVALIISFWYLRKPLSEMGKAQETIGEGPFAILSEVIPFGIMISTINSLWMLINYIDRVMIGYYISEQQVAVYTVATSLATLVMIFPTAIATIFFPVVSGLFGKEKKDEMAAVGGTSLRWMLFAIMPLALVMLTFPDSLLRMFYGEGYAVGSLTLVIFTIGLLIRSLSIMHGSALAAMRLVGIELKIAIVAAISNVALNALLIPRFGIDGAAIASSIAFAISTVLFIYYSRKLLGFTFPTESLKAVLAGGIALGFLLLAKPYLGIIFEMLPAIGEETSAELLSKALRLIVFGVLFLAGGALYLASLFLLKSFHEEDSSILSAAMKRVKMPLWMITIVEKIVIFGVHGTTNPKRTP